MESRPGSGLSSWSLTVGSVQWGLPMVLELDTRKAEQGQACCWCQQTTLVLSVPSGGESVASFAFCFRCGRGARGERGELPPIIGEK
jgi:hypothetical protein